MSSRSFRPRLLLLPLVFGMLGAPLMLRTTTTPAADHGMQADAVCSNFEEPVRHRLHRLPEETRSGPNCASCRAPLLNAPLAQAERDAELPADGDDPPAA